MCQHNQTETTEYEAFYNDDGGPEYEIVTVTTCRECGEVLHDNESETEEIPY